MVKERRLLALQRQVARLGLRLERLQQRSNRYSWARLAVFAVGVLASGVVFFLGDVRLFWVPLVLALLLFGLIVRVHRQIELSMARHQIWSQIKLAQIARMQLDWDNIPDGPLQPEHPLELDLDLVGQQSLHRLINTAVSNGGRQRLRQWLAAPATDPERTLQRQAVVRELVPLALFRDKLILGAILPELGAAESQGLSDVGWSADGLKHWLERHALPESIRHWLVLLGVLAALNVTLFTLSALGIAPPIWRVTILLYIGLFLIRSRETGEPFREAAGLRDSLEPLMVIFQELEGFRYRKTPHLKVLCAPFLKREQRPSSYLRRINRIISATGIRGNPLFWFVLNIVVPWDYYFAVRLDRCKHELAALLPAWLDVWFEIEALSSLANLAYLNPHFSFPSIVTADSDGQWPVFQAHELGHPLIPDGEKVCNDFTFETVGQVDLVTGSNMSGKSTFLRTVGLNLCLAFAGGPVNASDLQTMPLRLFTCIRISDSVTDGISYFYAEVKCLRSLLAELEKEHDSPLLYFIDEIFQGTNNRERLIGSRAYIKTLVGKRGVGLLSTHDLELVQLADEISWIKNYHFSDEVIDGRMVFDYKVHAGPSPTTNALRIMAMEGLPVEVN